MSKSNRKSTNRKPVRKSGNPAAPNTSSRVSPCRHEYTITAAQRWSTDMLECLTLNGHLARKFLFDDRFFTPLITAVGLRPSEEMAEVFRRPFIGFMLGISDRFHIHHPVTGDEMFSLEEIGYSKFMAVFSGFDSDQSEAAELLRAMCDTRDFATRWGEFLVQLVESDLHPPRDAFATRGFEAHENPVVVSFLEEFDRKHAA